MNAAATITVGSSIKELFAYRPESARTNFAKADWLIAATIAGDLLMVLAGLLLGYWVRFNSGWISVGNEPAGLTLRDYVRLIGTGAAFLLMTFGYLQLYSVRKLAVFRDAGLII